MPNYIQLPNGAFYPAKEGEDYATAMRSAFADYPDAFGVAKPAEPVKKSGLLADVLRGGQQMFSSERTGLASLLGGNEAAEAGLKRQENIQSQYAPQAGWEAVQQKYEKEGLLPAVGEYISQVPHAMAEQAPQIAQVMGASAAGEAAMPVGGGIVGAFAPSFLQQYGSFLESQAQEQKEKGQPVDVSRVRAAAAAVPAAIIDVAETMIPMGKGVMKSLFGPGVERLLAKGATAEAEKLATKKLANESFLKTLAVGTAKGAALEPLGEVSQDLIDNLQAGKPLFSDEALAGYGQTVYRTMQMGPLGAIGRVQEKSQAQANIAQTEANESALAAQKEAARLEAERNSPDALLKLDKDYENARSKMQALQTAAIKPKKGATDEEKEAYEQAKADHDDFKNNTFLPLKDQYNERKNAINALKTRYQQTEVEASREQPTAGKVPYQAPELAGLLQQREATANQLEELATKMGAAQPQEYPALRQQHQFLTQKLQDLGQSIGQAGGIPHSEFVNDAQAQIKALNKQIKTASTAFDKARDPVIRDYDAADKHAQTIAALTKQRDDLANEITQRQETERFALGDTGQQREMFGATDQLEDTPAKIAETKEAEQERAGYGVGSPKQGVPVKAEHAGRPPLMQDEQLSLFSTPEEKGDKPEEATHQQFMEMLGNRPGIKRERTDLFGQTYDDKAQARFTNGTYPDPVLQAIYDGNKSVTEGTDSDGNPIPVTEKYGAGKEGVENKLVSDQIDVLRRQVENKQRNAKKSKLQELHELAAQHEAYTNQLQRGTVLFQPKTEAQAKAAGVEWLPGLEKMGSKAHPKAEELIKPTTQDMATMLKGKFGKGEAAPTERPLTKREIAKLNTAIKNTLTKYQQRFNEITAVRKQIEDIYSGLHTTTPLKTTTEKKTESDIAARGAKSKSRTAATAARIERGDVRREAEKSEKMRNLARELGREEPQYIQFLKENQRRLKNLTERYGKGDPAVTKFANDMQQSLVEKAEQLGKATPEYKATLKEQVEYFKETLGQSKQEVPTKRTPQVTRKQSGAPKTLRTSSPESLAKTKARNDALSEYRKQYTKELEEARKFDEKNSFARGVETTSPDLTNTQVQSLESNDIQGALDSLAKDQDASQLNRVVAARLASLLDETQVEISNDLTDEEGKPVLGMATSKLVQLNRAGGLSQEILLHEGTHAATERVLVQYEKDPNSLTEIQRVAVRELKALHAAIKNDPNITSVSAKGSLSEFVAEVFSNKNLQNQLSKKKWRLSDGWKGFKSIILRMLGIKDPETMLGAALHSVDALMIPSSERMGGQEKAVSNKLSQKDIAALHDGSNSMKQFAEQFGTTAIKQKDRTVEDANRIGQEYLDDMYNQPLDHVAPAEQNKLDYRAVMSDGKEYDPENPLHYIEADAGTWANLKAQKDESLREREAHAITKERRKDLRALIKNMMDTPEYTYVEQALVAKAAAKFAVLSDKNGKLKLAAIEPNNRHNVALVSSKDAGAVIAELRAGKPLKQAFLDGMQKNANENAQLNENKNGWYKFDQSAVYKDAEKLNAACSGTSWCTGASTNTAASQLKGGDFYVHFVNGKPEVAVRMDGQNKIGEIRGNTPNQSLTNSHEKIAEDFLKAKDFEGSQKYLDDLFKKRELQEIIRGEKDFGPAHITELEDLFSPSGKLEDNAVEKLLTFRSLEGYSSLRPDPSENVKKVFEEKVLRAADTLYKDGYYFGSEFSTDAFSHDGEFEVTFGDNRYSVTANNVKAVQGLSVSFYGRGEHSVTLPALESVQRINTFKGRVVLPALKRVDNIIAFTNADSVVEVPADATIALVRSADKDATLTIKGAKTIGRVELRRGSYSLILHAPDVEYAKVLFNGPSVANRMVSKVNDAIETEIKTFPEGERIAQALRNLDDFWDTAEAGGSDIADTVTEVIKTSNNAVLDALKNTLPKELYDRVVNTLTDINDIQDVDPYFFTDSVTDALFAEEPDQQKVLQYLSKAFKKLFNDLDFELPNVGFDAPKLKGETPPVKVQKGNFGEEAPQYARAQTANAKDNENVGVYKTANGGLGFRTRLQQTGLAPSFVAKEPSLKDKLLGNMLGLAGRVQNVDALGALDEALKVGVDKKVLSNLEAQNAQYAMRFGQHRSEYANLFINHGPVTLKENKTAQGVEYVYSVKKGVKFADAAEALQKAKWTNDTEAEAVWTAYVTGERARVKGWDKLNYDNPAQMKAEYDRMMSSLSPEQLTALKEATRLYQEYNNGLLDFNVATGSMTKELANDLKRTPYIPFYRATKNGDVELVVDKERPVRLGNIKDEPELHALIGDNKQILPIFTSAVQNTFMLVQHGLRNQSVKESGFALRKLGIASRLAPGTGPASKDVVRFKVKGIPHYMVVDSDMYGIPADLIVKGMEGIKTTLPVLVKMLGYPANVLRKFVVRMPTYAIRQAIKDPLTAWMTAGTDAMPILSSFKELSKMVAGRSETESHLIESGAIISNVFSGDQRDMAQMLKQISTGKNGWTKGVAYLDSLAMKGEASTRAVIYKDSLAKGMTEQAALLRTVEAMNFRRRGLSPSMQWLSTMTPFFNAQIQSLDVLYRAFRGELPFEQQLQIRQKMYARGMLLALGTLAYAAMMQDDDAYKNAKPEERYSNWFVYLPGVKEPLRVPMPFELGFLFKSLPEAVFNTAYGDEKAHNALKGLGKLAEQFNPFSIPQGVKPAIEAYLGKSFFNGDIESQREKSILPTERYRDNTTELSKMLGQVTGKAGVSPITLDYLIRGYTGSLGVALVALANPILNTEATASVQKPTTELSKMPFIGGLFQPVEGRGTLDEAYDTMETLRQVKGTYTRLMEQGKKAEAQAFANQYVNQLALSSTSGAVYKQLGLIAKQEQMVRSSPKMSTAEKDARLEKLTQMKASLAKRFIALADRTTPQ